MQVLRQLHHGLKEFIVQIAEEKVHKLFFAGGIRHAMPFYSHGVRQTVAMLFNDTPGMPEHLFNQG